MTKGLVIKLVENEEELQKVFNVREEVFIKEQNVSREEEMDEFDETATHIIAYYDGKVAGCSRIRCMGNRAKLERLAILPEFRKMGVGTEIVKFMVEHSRKMGAVEAYGHAQCYAHDFYVKCGFVARGGEFMEAGIRHIEMYKELR